MLVREQSGSRSAAATGAARQTLNASLKRTFRQIFTLEDGVCTRMVRPATDST